MPEYLSPGVYVEEVDAGPKPIAPVATSTAACVGRDPRGPAQPDPGHQLRRLRPRVWRAARPFPTRPPGGRGTTARPLVARRRVGQGLLRRGRRHGCSSSGSSRRRPRPRAAAVQRRPVRAPAERCDEGLSAGHAQPPHDGGRGRRLDLVSAEDGSVLGTGDGGRRSTTARSTVTLTADAGVSARCGRDLVRIIAVDTARNVLTVSAGERRCLGRRPRRPAAARRRRPAPAGPRAQRAGRSVTTTTAAARGGSHDDHRRAGGGIAGPPTTAAGFAYASTAERHRHGHRASPRPEPRRPDRWARRSPAPCRPAARCRSCARLGDRAPWRLYRGSGRLYPGALVQLEGARRCGAAAGDRVGGRVPGDPELQPTGDLPGGRRADASWRPTLSVRYRPAGGDEVTRAVLRACGSPRTGTPSRCCAR